MAELPKDKIDSSAMILDDHSRKIDGAAKADPDSYFRFNWSAPMLLSLHDPSTLYVAGNYVYKSTNKGQTWTIISPDLSTNDAVKRKQGVSGGITPDNTGAETHCSVHSLSESSISPLILWAGTDDGQVHVTKDGGRNWTNVRANIPEVPQDIWVSRVIASHHDPNRAYVTFDGHRSDHFGTWVFTTDDAGQSWARITDNLTAGEVVRVIREDRVNQNLLFIGTETGVWYSLNRGQNWHRLQGLPTVSIYDLKVHPRENDLIIGTHGRSIWIVDDISPLQQLTTVDQDADLHLFEQKEATIWKNISRGGQRGHFWFAGENPDFIENTSSIPRAGYNSLVPISFYIGENGPDSVSVMIMTPSGDQSVEMKIAVSPGINRCFWNREFASLPYTSEQNAKISGILEDLMTYNKSSRVIRIHSIFHSDADVYTKRSAIQTLKTSYLNYALPDGLGIPQAGPGTYRIQLRSGANVKNGSIVIREDPMTRE